MRPALLVTVPPLLLLLAAAVSGSAGLTATDGHQVSFTGHQVLRVFVTRNSTVDLLRRYRDEPGVDFWTEPSGLAPTVDVMVSPDVRRELTDQLTSSGVTYTVNIDDVQAAIAAENPQPLSEVRERLNLQKGHPLTWKAYHRLGDHHQYLDYVAKTYPDICATFSIGTSTEGRDLKGVRCGTGAREVWMDGGIHAREWISTAVVSYIIQEFSEKSSKYEDILTNFTIYSIPVLNPDGYEFTHDGNRLWRKTRSKNAGSDCYGVDANRNFDFHWNEVGISTEPCSDLYAGPYPFSEPETIAVKEFLLNHASMMDMYLSFHSYSQLVLLPYGHSDDQPDDYDELERVAKRGRRRILSPYGKWFKISQPSRALYAVSGISQDWAKAVAGIKYSYTFELRDTGQHGFLLPADQIEPSGREILDGVVAMIREII